MSNDDTEQGVPRFTIAFGGIKPGSSLGLGPALGFTFADRSYLQLTAEYSIRNFKLFQLRYRSRRLFGNRAAFGWRARWQDAPDLAIYRLGAESPPAHAAYGEQRTEISGEVDVRPRPHWLLTAGGGFERYRETSGTLVSPVEEALPEVPALPGLATNVAFAHVFAGASYDTRPSPDYARTGWSAQAAVHQYHDASTGAFSFRQTELFGNGILPNAGERGALDLLAHVWSSAPAKGADVPFFLMPYLGAGDYLRGYRLYRYRDRDGLLLSAEYRLAVHEHVDILGFVDEGTVARSLRDLGRAPLRPAIGAGVLLHAARSTVARLDLARGREGVQLSISFSSPSSGIF